ncbi:MAG: hypothetical protein C9356_15615 [Oleiphilus sp.]|nr:MAG: hypothetical protein C9356_15615 [Oleiphilus sp.]
MADKSISTLEQMASSKPEKKSKRSLAKHVNPAMVAFDVALKGGNVVSRTMPVSKTKVKFTLMDVDLDDAYVSDLNKRSFEFLKESAVSDILPSIQNEGQLEPGYARKDKDGKFELVDCSRRYWCLRHIGAKTISLWVGDIPDEDVERLSEIANIGVEVSAYERGLFYLKVRDRFPSERELHKHYEEEDGVSRTTIRNRIALAMLSPKIIKLFGSPNDLMTTHVKQLSLVDAYFAENKRRRNEWLKDYHQDLLKEYSLSGKWPDTKEIVQTLVKKATTRNPSDAKDDEFVDGKGKRLFVSKRRGQKLTLDIRTIDQEKYSELVRFMCSLLDATKRV